MASYLGAAQTFAEQQAALLKQQLADLYTNQASVKDASVAEAEAKKQQLLAAINQQQQTVQTQYGTDAKQAYINKMLAGNTVNDNLSRMNLNNTGFGVGQQLANETAYGSNLSSLQNTRNTNLQSLINKANDTELGYNTDVAGINSNYAANLADTDQYVQSALQNAKESAYDKYISDQQYQDSINQQSFENDISRQNLEINKYNSYGSKPKTYTNQAAPYETGVKGILDSAGKKVTYTLSNGDKYILPAGTNPWTGTVNKAVTTNGVFDAKKAMANSYQPKTYQGKILNPAKNKAGNEVRKVNVNGQDQTVWSNGKVYTVWDGTINDYKEVIYKNGNWQVK